PSVSRLPTLIHSHVPLRCLLPCPTRRSSDLLAIWVIRPRMDCFDMCATFHAFRSVAEYSRFAANLCDLQGLETSAASTTETSATDRQSTRLNSSHVSISYAVFCLKKKE